MAKNIDWIIANPGSNTGRFVIVRFRPFSGLGGEVLRVTLHEVIYPWSAIPPLVMITTQLVLVSFQDISSVGFLS